MKLKPRTIRCAIYTRKSTDHNLDLEFNSLHAQREACEAYIRSQLHEGWQLVPDPYDDGAFSGASLERPDLQRLLGDIAAGRIDNVVVYKVDRLTRSLTDFAKLVDLFDRHGVSFVSVTQAFNTTTSMGRLTLNVLLSFAQFEREVIGERVRDKIAASKKKGLFMGGGIPLGYINRDKKLVVVPDEAERVRWIFRRYLELGSLGRLLEEMNRLKIRTKVLTPTGGARRGGVPYGKGALAYLLKNRCYVGELVHKGQIYPADHEPSVDRATFDAVQASLAAGTVARATTARTSPFLLQGFLFDSAGNRMTPSHSRKKGVRYRYYISHALLQSRKADAGQVTRVPAPEIETQIERLVRVRAPNPNGDLRSMVEAQVERVTVSADAILVELARTPGGSEQAAGQTAQTVRIPWSKKPLTAPKGVLDGTSRTAELSKSRKEVLPAIGRARRWVGELLAGSTLSEIARREGKGERQLRLLIPLAFLSPQTVKAIADETCTPVPVTELARSVSLVWPSLVGGSSAFLQPLQGTCIRNQYP